MGHQEALDAGGLQRQKPATAPALPAFDIVTRHLGGHVRVNLGGSVTLEHMVSTLHVLGVESESWTEPGVLIDLVALQTGFGRPELVRIGEEIACSFAHLPRLAILVPSHRVTRISERTARRSGFNLRVFDLESSALAWLGEP